MGILNITLDLDAPSFQNVSKPKMCKFYGSAVVSKSLNTTLLEYQLSSVVLCNRRVYTEHLLTLMFRTKDRIKLDKKKFPNPEAGVVPSAKKKLIVMVVGSSIEVSAVRIGFFDRVNAERLTGDEYTGVSVVAGGAMHSFKVLKPVKFDYTSPRYIQKPNESPFLPIEKQL